MDIKKVALGVWALAKDNAPAILKGIAYASGGAAVVAAFIGQHKADKIMNNLPDGEQNIKGRIKHTWWCYAPAVGLEGVSIVSNVLSDSKTDERYKAALAAATLSSDKAEEIVDKAKEKLGIEDKKVDESAKDADHKILFTEQIQNVYEPISGLRIRTKLSDLYGAATRVAEDWDNSTWISIGDIVRNCADVEYATELPESVNQFGWRPSDDNVESCIPVFEDGYLAQDGTTCVKMKFTMKPKAKDCRPWGE